jgi:hypothetical protein
MFLSAVAADGLLLRAVLYIFAHIRMCLSILINFFTAQFPWRKVRMKERGVFARNLVNESIIFLSLLPIRKYGIKFTKIYLIRKFFEVLKTKRYDRSQMQVLS